MAGKGFHVNSENFKAQLLQAKTEEAVKHIYAQYFNIKYDTTDRHDLYTETVLFEFKNDKNFKNIKILAQILAQTLYYIRRLKYSDTEKPIPYFICMADSDEAAITEVKKWKTYFSNDSYNWECAPSNPDSKLIDALVKDSEISKIVIYNILRKGEHENFKTNLKNALSPQLLLDFGDKKIINEENFESVFDHWKSVLGKYIINGYKPAHYFLSNIQKDKIKVDSNRNKVTFTFEDNNKKTQEIPIEVYKHFWGMYEYVSDSETITGIHSKFDRLNDDSARRYEGEFYTPLHFAQKSIHYLDSVLGKNWSTSGKYRIWDMAAGTGNLEYHLPAKSYQYLYLSTLHSSDVDHLKKIFPKSTCFQYDYLNDDVGNLFSNLPFSNEWKIPENLQSDLKNPKITWIVFINPPFATAQNAKQKDSKTGVSKTAIEKVMDREEIGHTKRELFAQFMFRIVNELPQNTYLAMYSKLKYLNAPDSIKYRDKYFNFHYEKGFLFKSTNFHGVKGKYPIGFLIWNLNKPRNQTSVEIDISDDDAKTIGVKHLRLINENDVLNNWFPRPQNSNDYILPPLSNGITVKNDNTDTRHRARPDFLASVCSNGNDFQHANYVVILSSPNASAGAFTVIKENFDKALTLHAVKKIPKQTWLNDRNQFLIPNKEPSSEFINDCIIWSLFASSNETTSLSDVNYLGKTYQIKNQLFPFQIKELEKWNISVSSFKKSMKNDHDRFAALWLTDKTISSEAKSVINAGKEIYKIFYENADKLFTKKWKISSWDAGWYQIRNSLKESKLGTDRISELKILHDLLGYKILPQIEEYGFLDKDEIFI